MFCVLFWCSVVWNAGPQSPNRNSIEFSIGIRIEISKGSSLREATWMWSKSFCFYWVMQLTWTIQYAMCHDMTAGSQIEAAAFSFVDSCRFAWVHLICRSLLVITIYQQFSVGNCVSTMATAILLVAALAFGSSAALDVRWVRDLCNCREHTATSLEIEIFRIGNVREQSRLDRNVNAVWRELLHSFLN